MKAILVLILMMATAVNAYSSIREYQSARIVSIIEDQDPLELLPNTSNEVYPYLPDLKSRPEIPSVYNGEWGTDRLISNECCMENSIISLDYDNDGFLYVVLISKNSQYDTLKIYKSTDQGVTWNRIVQFTPLVPYKIFDVEMRVNHTGSDPHIYFFMIDSFSVTNKRSLWFCTIDQPSMTSNWKEFPDTVTIFENPLELSMDITDEAIPDIWCSYSRVTASNYGWASIRSSDAGVTWSVNSHSTNRGGRDPYISFGTDYVYEVCVYTNTSDSNAIRCCITYIGGGGDYIWVSDQNLQGRTRPCVASTRIAYRANRVEVLYEEIAVSGEIIKESFSNDAGLTWTLSQLWPMTGDVKSVRPYVRSGWQTGVCSEFCAVAAIPGAFDSLVVAYNVDGNWTSRITVNDYRVTGEVTSQATVTLGGRAVEYRQYGSDNVWFDSNDNVAVEETPAEVLLDWNITGQNNFVRVSFTLEAPQNVTLKMYDALGRNVLTEDFGTVSEGSHSYVLNTGEMTIGRYFVSVRAGDKNFSKSVVLF